MSEKISKELALKFISKFNALYPNFKNQKLKIHRKILEDWKSTGSDVEVFLTQKGNKITLYFNQNNKPYQATDIDYKLDIEKDLPTYKKEFDSGLGKEMDESLKEKNTRRITINKAMIEQFFSQESLEAQKSPCVVVLPGVVNDDDSSYGKEYNNRVTLVFKMVADCENLSTEEEGSEKDGNPEEDYYDRNSLCPPGVC